LKSFKGARFDDVFQAVKTEIEVAGSQPGGSRLGFSNMKDSDGQIKTTSLLCVRFNLCERAPNNH